MDKLYEFLKVVYDGYRPFSMNGFLCVENPKFKEGSEAEPFLILEIEKYKNAKFCSC